MDSAICHNTIYMWTIYRSSGHRRCKDVHIMIAAHQRTVIWYNYDLLASRVARRVPGNHI